jgi:hypothetical protein
MFQRGQFRGNLDETSDVGALDKDGRDSAKLDNVRDGLVVESRVPVTEMLLSASDSRI